MTLQQLFELPPEVRQPHAYQLFGLTPGEQSDTVIQAAIQKRISHVKSLRSTLSPELWQQAVQLIQMARAVLSNPEQKAELDARFGIFASPAPSAPPPPDDDPLAGLLPPSAPTTRPPATRPPTSTPPMPRPPVVSPVVEPEASHSPTRSPVDSAPLDSLPRVRSVKRTVRRRRSWVGLLFGLFVITSLAAIAGGLAYFTLFGPGRIEIVKADGAITVRTGTANSPATGPNASQPVGPVKSQPEMQSHDPILAAPREDSEPPMSIDGNPVNVPQPEVPAMEAPAINEEHRVNEPAMETEVPAITETSEPEMVVPPPDTSPPSNPIPPSDPIPPTAEEIAAAQGAIDNAIKAIVAADFAVMKSLAENAQSFAKTPEQKEAADTLYQFADLATFYDEGISRAMASLKPLDEFMVNVNTPVIIQEISPESITVLLNKQNFGIPRKEMPMSIAHGLAALQIPVDKPAGLAAKAVYQSIAPKANADHRTEAIEILQGLQDMDGASPPKLAEFIATFPPRS